MSEIDWYTCAGRLKRNASHTMRNDLCNIQVGDYVATRFNYGLSNQDFGFYEQVSQISDNIIFTDNQQKYDKERIKTFNIKNGYRRQNTTDIEWICTFIRLSENI
jgi:hypothetical protein